MKKRLYVKTTVVSYLAAKPSRDIIVARHQGATRDIWPAFAAKFDTYISALAFEEAGRGDREQARLRLAAIASFPMLGIDDEAKNLATDY